MTRRAGLRQIVFRSAWLRTCLLITAVAVGGFSLFCWPCDLVSHFPIHLAAAAVLAAAMFAGVGRLRHAVVPALTAVWCLLALVPFYGSGQAALAETPAYGRMIRVAAMNVAAHNRETQRVLAFIRATQLDIVLVTELNDFWARALEEIAVDFPFRQIDPREGHYGIGLMSRLPLSVRDDKPAGAQSIVATIVRPHVTIVGTHTFPPFTPQAFERRNQQYAQIAAFIRQQKQPVVLVGDLNSSSWSPAFRDFLRTAALVDTRVGRGVQPTWPAWLPIAQVPIALVSRGVRVHSRWLGPSACCARLFRRWALTLDVVRIVPAVCE